MKIMLALALAATLVLPAAAFELGSSASPKPAVHHLAPVPDPAMLRQGGDTILDAVELIVPTDDLTGTTAGYTDDYDEVCPYEGSTSPDVVYTYLPYSTITVDIDMLGSAYDTKIYVYDEDLELVACNDDFYPDYVSRLEFVELSGGVRYYLVIDGWNGDFGDYVLNVHEVYVDILMCPVGEAELEGEPPLVDDYVDEYNGGCNNLDVPGAPLFQPLNAQVFCGMSGWYLSGDINSRDTDWFLVTLPPTGVLTITGDANQPTYLFELGPQDCDAVGVLQNVVVGPISSDEIVLTGDPGSEVWFWVGPTIFEAPPGALPEYLYVLWLDSPVTTEEHSWSEVKALFD